MGDRDIVDELRQIAEYRRAVKLFRASGWGGIAFGIFNMVLAIYWLQFNLINVILLFIALGMFCVGLWELVFPMAEAAIFDGLIAIAIGLWNVFVTVLNAAAGGFLAVQWFLFSVFIIGWGVSRFVMYRRLSDALRAPPDADALQHLDSVTAYIKKAKAADAPDIIGFRTQAFMKQQDWKGQLGADAAIFLDKRGYDILVGHKDEVRIEVKGKVFLGKTLKASIRVGTMSFAQGTISPQSYERYQSWKARDEEIPKAERSVEKPDSSGDEGFFAKPSL